MTHKCGMCPESATSFVVWGVNWAQRANLCAAHVAELWERIKGPVANGVGVWIQGEPKGKLEVVA